MADPELDNFITGLLEWTKFLPAKVQHPLEILVLRGHLLIERELRVLIDARLTRPRALVRNPFSNTLRLAEALYGDTIPKWVWEGTKQLNAIRNSLAHSLEDEMRSHWIEKLIEHFKAKDKKLWPHIPPAKLEQLAYCVASIHLELVKARTIKGTPSKDK